MTTYDVCRVDGDATLADAHAVRRTVFIDEQGVPESVEIDGRDDEATHVVAYDGDRPVGTARLRVVDDHTAKAERVAVLPDERGGGLGARLMERVEREARQRGCERISLHAQTTVEPFYHGLGYETVGEEFEQAGIPHVEMEKGLSQD